jgi:hypothetical protein
MFRLFRTPASVRKMSLFSCISSEGSDFHLSMFRLFRTPASVRKMSLFSCISSERSDVHVNNVQAVQN